MKKKQKKKKKKKNGNTRRCMKRTKRVRIRQGKCIGLEDELTSISFGRNKSRPNIRNENIDEDTDQ